MGSKNLGEIDNKKHSTCHLDLDIPPIYDILLQMPTHCPLCCKKKDNRLATHNDMYGRVLFIKKGESSQQNIHFWL